jgi:transcriptional regulator with XRE-family HTH domain
VKTFKRSGLVLKSFREKLGKTQIQISSVYNLHTQYISNFERGICLPPVDTMKAIFKLKGFPKDIFKEALKEDLFESQMQKYK